MNKNSWNKKIKTVAFTVALSLIVISCNSNQDGEAIDAIHEETTVQSMESPETSSELVEETVTETEEVDIESTPVDDVYNADQIMIEDISEEDVAVLDSSLIDATGVQVTDQNIISKLEQLCDKFFYNFLFEPDLVTGIITAEDMQAFAISYIAQYEYSELKFDTENFISYIPEELVTEIVEVYFAKEFHDHKAPLDERIAYEDFNYLMPALGEIDKGEMSIMEVYSLSDGVYKVNFEEILEFRPVDSEKEHFEVVFKMVENRYVLVSYKNVIDIEEEVVEGEETEALEENTEEESTTNE